MKHTIKKLLIPALCVTLSAGKASAGDEAIAAIGGFVSGIFVSKVFHHNKHQQRPHVVYVEQRRPAHSAPKYYKHGHKKHHCDHACGHSHPQPKGYYKSITVKQWVPGCWTIRYDRCGTRARHWEPGYYTHVEKRVWVSSGSDRQRHATYANNGRH